MPRALTAFTLFGSALIASSAWGQWVNFTNETSTRLVADPSIGANDPEEKDYAWGDFDRDGDTDLVVVRKEPFSTPGRRRNVLFMNEGIAEGHAIDGVLVDRTVEYASAADDGGQGMLDLTNDRDVIATDVNGDGWLDLVTAPTYGVGLPKTISHPRVYINLGEVDGQWQGFRYEEARIPQFPSHPNFCGVGAGDIDGDKLPDLYFVDYDSGFANNFEDRLLVNDGDGFFTDQSTLRLTSAMLSSSFGTTAHIVDMNGDGWLDIVKSENGPVKTHYNNGTGFFTQMQNTYSQAAYHASVGDLNHDGRMDIIVSDDTLDRYLLNTGNNAANQATFSQFTFPDSSGFNGNSHHADLNNDGHMDVFICDVDVDAPFCGRTSRLFRNSGNLPNVSMVNLPHGIPNNMLTGVFDVAIIDINRDGWLDLVIGRCSGTQIWINQPPSGLAFNFPQGLPAFIPSDQPYTFQLQLDSIGSVVPQDGSAKLHYSINGSAFTTVNLQSIDTNLYAVTLPSMQCTDIVNFYFTAQSTSSATFRDPPNAPNTTYNAVSGDGTEITMQDGLEGDTSGWTVQNHPSLTGGAWEVVDPIGSINIGSLAAPEDDAGAGDDVMAFVTQNGPVGGPAGVADVDGGPTYLISPTIDLAGTDATITYARWFYCEEVNTPEADLLFTEVSNDNGNTWVSVHSTSGTNGSWESVSFHVGEFVTPTSQVRVRFWTADSPNNSITEAGIDDLTVEVLVCGGGNTCSGDVDGNSTVGVEDLIAVINAWGPCTDCPADINGSGMVDVADLLAVISAWGPCP